jgi:hypothetical protein
MTKFEDNLSPYLTFAEQASTPSTPATGYALFYRKTDNLWYVLDDAGTETAIGTASDLATHIADTTSAHTAAGVDIVDAGGYLTATNVEAALQEAMAEVDANTALAHAENHASRHSDGGADEVTVENLATAAVDTTYALKPDGLGGVAFGAVSAVGALDDLSDVDTDKSKTPADGDVLTYDGTDWNAEAAAGGGASVIDDLTDVDTDKSKTPADGDILTYDGTHWNAEAATGGGAVAAVGARATRSSSAQTVSGVSAKTLELDTVDFDTDSFFDLAGANPSRFTVPAGQGGQYVITGGIYMNATGTSGEHDVKLLVNGTSVGFERRKADSSGIALMGLTAILDLNAADYVEIEGSNTASDTSWEFRHDAANSYLAGTKMQGGSGSGLSTGTSFPVSPTAGDRYRRSDLDYGIYFYDGTRWLSEETRTVNWGGYRFNTSSNGATDATLTPNPWGDTDVSAQLVWSGLINGTSDGSNYWTIALRHYSKVGGSWQDLSGSPTVTTATAGASLEPSNVVGSATILSSSVGEMGIRWDATGSPGGLFGALGLVCRKVAT